MWVLIFFSFHHKLLTFVGIHKMYIYIKHTSRHLTFTQESIVYNSFSIPRPQLKWYSKWIRFFESANNKLYAVWVHATSKLQFTWRIVECDHEYFTRLWCGFANAKIFGFQPNHLCKVSSIDIGVQQSYIFEIIVSSHCAVPIRSHLLTYIINVICQFEIKYERIQQININFTDGNKQTN